MAVQSGLRPLLLPTQERQWDARGARQRFALHATVYRYCTEYLIDVTLHCPKEDECAVCVFALLMILSRKSTNYG